MLSLILRNGEQWNDLTVVRFRELSQLFTMCQVQFAGTNNLVSLFKIFRPKINGLMTQRNIQLYQMCYSSVQVSKEVLRRSIRCLITLIYFRVCLPTIFSPCLSQTYLQKQDEDFSDSGTVASSSKITTQHVDFFGTVCAERAVNMTRVEKLINVTYPYSLQFVRWNIWAQFPDMNIVIDLELPQYVLISYRIIGYSTGTHYLITRVKIDEVENTHFRDMSGNIHYRSNSASKQVYLEKGSHTITVEYRNDGTTSNQQYSDWNCALFTVEYYKYQSDSGS